MVLAGTLHAAAMLELGEKPRHGRALGVSQRRCPQNQPTRRRLGSQGTAGRPPVVGREEPWSEPKQQLLTWADAGAGF